MVKRKLTMVLLILSLLLAACSNDEQSAGNANGDATGSDTNKPVTLKVLVASDWLKEKKWQMVFDAYEKKTGNKLDIQSAPVNNYMDLVNTRIATKDAPDLLFYWGQEAKIKQLQPEKNLVDLSNEEFASRITPSVKNYFLSTGDKLYGIPVTGLNVSGVIYNKQVFSDLGIEIPKTYEEFLAVCEKIKASGIMPLYEAGKEGWPLQLYTFSAMASVINKQPDVMDKINAHQVTFDQVPEYVNTLQKQQELLQKGYLNEDLFSATLDMSLEAISTGKAAMIFQADWEIDPILTKYPDAQIGMFPLPWNDDAYAGISDPIGLYALNNSENSSAAQEFLKFFASEEVLNDYFNTVKSIPTWTGLTVDLNPGTADMNAYVEEGKAVPFFNALTVVEIGDYQGLLQQMYGGTMSPEQVAQNLQSNIDKAAKAAGIAGF
ncbi:extracellular solute-binding protein [Paenibacillus amylolyticus]|uniref:ABC transporter substrate-binding protein n=1 Tax=Paenibacillus amylolyticus TaxID=1451 RepID=UPI003241F388